MREAVRADRTDRTGRRDRRDRGGFRTRGARGVRALRCVGPLPRLGLLTGALLALGLTACRTFPIPLSAQAGSTIAIPVANGGQAGLAYGGKDFTDYQRGELVYQLDGAGGFELETRYTIAAAAHKASLLAAVPQLSTLSLPWTPPVQVISVVDIPDDAPEGTHTFHIVRRQAGQPDVDMPDYTGTIQILPHSIPVNGGAETAVGTPTPNRITNCTSSCGFVNLYKRVIPRPQVRISMDNAVAAFEMVVTYPSSIIDVVDAVREENTDAAPNRDPMIWIDDDDAGTVTIKGVTHPDGSGWGVVSGYLDLVFELVDGATQILDLTQNPVQVSSLTAYDANGALIPDATANVVGIR